MDVDESVENVVPEVPEEDKSEANSAPQDYCGRAILPYKPVYQH